MSWCSLFINVDEFFTTLWLTNSSCIRFYGVFINLPLFINDHPFHFWKLRPSIDTSTYIARSTSCSQLAAFWIIFIWIFGCLASAGETGVLVSLKLAICRWIESRGSFVLSSHYHNYSFIKNVFNCIMKYSKLRFNYPVWFRMARSGGICEI